MSRCQIHVGPVRSITWSSPSLVEVPPLMSEAASRMCNGNGEAAALLGGEIARERESLRVLRGRCWPQETISPSGVTTNHTPPFPCPFSCPGALSCAKV
jgi:hypothetical protein